MDQSILLITVTSFVYVLRIPGLETVYVFVGVNQNHLSPQLISSWSMHTRMDVRLDIPLFKRAKEVLVS